LSNLNIKSNYYGLIFILSVIGTILFVFTEFGGYVSYYAYSIDFGSSFRNPDLLAYSPFFILVTVLFLINIFLPLKELNIIKTSFPRNSAKLGFYSSLGILAITAIGGIILSGSGARDWWFGSGFYAGIIGGILLPLLYRFVMKNPSTNPAVQATVSVPGNFCRNCGTQNNAGAVFCQKCGKPLS